MEIIEIRKPINEYKEINPINIREYRKYFKKLYNEDENITKQNTTQSKIEALGPQWKVTENQMAKAI